MSEYKANVKSEIDERGRFIRQGNLFTTPFGEKEGELKAEAGRYKLYWAKGCHWSNRASIVRELLGLEDAIEADIVDSEFNGKTNAWKLPTAVDGPDPETGVTFLY